MHYLIVLLKAQRDASSAYRYLDSERLGLGRKFLARLKKCLAGICRNPYRYSIAYGQYRQGYEPKFHYIFYYAVVNDTVIVHAIVHSARDQDPILKSLP